MTNEQALAGALANVPANVHAALTAAGYVPTGDGGNMWFYDKGNLRLCFGMDGSDYPQSMCDVPTVVRMDLENGDESLGEWAISELSEYPKI